MRTMFFATSTILLASLFGTTGTGQEGFNRATGPSLSGATSWMNSPPVTLASLRGKVVLIDFWTYSCINWRRTLPYVREWASKYKDQGLVVIGVHTPEFSFEQKTDNVGKAVREMNIDYPVALDNNYEIWHSFQNEYWPALYLIDGKGRIRYEKFGEGDYLECELKIQELLKKASAQNVPDEPVTLQPEGFEAAADWDNLKSPENYIGYTRTQWFASPGGVMADKEALYAAPAHLKLNQWALSGQWLMGKEQARLTREQGRLIYRFHARDLHLIMGPAAPGSSIRFRVLIDGNPPGPSHGLDIDNNGNGVINEHRMYQLIRQQGPIVDREFQIEFLEAGVEVYDLTFG